MLRLLTVSSIALVTAIGYMAVFPDWDEAHAMTEPDDLSALGVSDIAPVVASTRTQAPAPTGSDTAVVKSASVPSGIAPTPRPERTAVAADTSARKANQRNLETLVRYAQNTEQDTGSDSLRDLTQSVLADLGIKIHRDDASQNSAKTEDMKSLTEGALAGISAIRPAPEPEEPGLDDLLAQSIRDGEVDNYLDDLIANAVAKGQATVPQEFLTTEGKVDTRTLLAAIALRAENAAPPAQATSATAPKPVAVKATRAKATPDAPPLGPGRTYRVTAGDSLAYISLLYYGTPSLYTKIFEANRDYLESPSKILIGQRIVIPK